MTFILILITLLSSPSMPACEYEDGPTNSTACYWDADTKGNGEGRDLINYPDGTFKYVG